MQSADSTFWKYAFSFGALLLLSFVLLFLTSHFGSKRDAPETTCITSSGETC